jgi:hypothetical protein
MFFWSKWLGIYHLWQFPLSATTCLPAGRSFSFCHPELVEGTKRKRIFAIIGAKG